MKLRDFSSSLAVFSHAAVLPFLHSNTPPPSFITANLKSPFSSFAPGSAAALLNLPPVEYMLVISLPCLKGKGHTVLAAEARRDYLTSKSLFYSVTTSTGDAPKEKNYEFLGGAEGFPAFPLTFCSLNFSLMSAPELRYSRASFSASCASS